MGDRDALLDWKAFEAHSIPTKGINLPPLFEEALLQAAQAVGLQAANAAAVQHHGLQILELGCGCGELAENLSAQGHDVVGVDANENAISLARERKHVNRCRFLVDDVTTFRIPNYSTHNDGVDHLFDFCILQLLLSIVGNVAKRRQKATSNYSDSTSFSQKGWTHLPFMQWSK